VSALGQHNLQILRDVVELSDTDMQRLVDTGVLATRPRRPINQRLVRVHTRHAAEGPLADTHYKEAVRALVDSTAGLSGRHT